MTPLGTFATPDIRFDNIHIDNVGPLPPSNGYTYILTCIDRFTRWPEAIPIREITAETVVQAFLSGWMARYGDGFTQFVKQNGIEHIRTSPYHQLQMAWWRGPFKLLRWV